MEQAEQYPVVRIGQGVGPRLDWENDATLFILQASQGLIGPEVLGVSVEAKPEEIVVHVCLREENEAVTEDLDDLMSEFDALQVGTVEPEVRVSIVKYLGNTDRRWPGYLHRRIFLVNDRVRDSEI